MTASAGTGRAVLLRRAFSRCAKITVKGARYARVAVAMALRATLECDLARQDLGTYQEGRGKVTRSPLLVASIEQEWIKIFRWL
jgi:hypothetical protein